MNWFDDDIEIEKIYKKIYYFKDMCKINIDYLKTLYSSEDSEKSIIAKEYTILNKLGLYTIEGQYGKIRETIKQREFITGLINKNYFHYFKDYLLNRGDVFFSFKSFDPTNLDYDCSNLKKDDTDLSLEREENSHDDVWKIRKDIDIKRYVEEIYSEYREICNKDFFSILNNNYILIFISNRKYSSEISIVKLLLFLFEYSNYKIKEEKQKNIIKLL